MSIVPGDGVHTSAGDGVDQSFTPPPSPNPGDAWPAPTRTVYPMKPSDSLLEDGRIFSGALDRVKAVQHEQRVVVRWIDGSWVVARRRLLPLAPHVSQEGFGDDGRSFGVIFDPEPEQWGLRGDPYVWAEICDRLEGSPVPVVAEEAVSILHDAFRVVVGVALDEPLDRVAVERFDHGGMSGGWVDLKTWREHLMPLLEARLATPEA